MSVKHLIFKGITNFILKIICISNPHQLSLALSVEIVIKSGLRNWEEEAKEKFNQNVERSLYIWCMAPFIVLSILIFEQSNLKK